MKQFSKRGKILGKCWLTVTEQEICEDKFEKNDLKQKERSRIEKITENCSNFFRLLNSCKNRFCKRNPWVNFEKNCQNQSGAEIFKKKYWK